MERCRDENGEPVKEICKVRGPAKHTRASTWRVPEKWCYRCLERMREEKERKKVEGRRKRSDGRGGENV